MQTHEQLRRAFLEWLDASRAHNASWRDRHFIAADGQEYPTAYLMGHLFTITDDLPPEQSWIVSQYPEFVGKQALPTYQNAVRVVRAQRRQ
jgi:hypothetical protein